jgi:hypothetical protein
MLPCRLFLTGDTPALYQCNWQVSRPITAADLDASRWHDGGNQLSDFDNCGVSLNHHAKLRQPAQCGLPCQLSSLNLLLYL